MASIYTKSALFASLALATFIAALALWWLVATPSAPAATTPKPELSSEQKLQVMRDLAQSSASSSVGMPIEKKEKVLTKTSSARPVETSREQQMEILNALHYSE